MKIVSTRIDLTQPERSRIIKAGDVITKGVKASLRSLCHRFAMMTVERIEAENGVAKPEK